MFIPYSAVNKGRDHRLIRVEPYTQPTVGWKKRRFGNVDIDSKK